MQFRTLVKWGVSSMLGHFALFGAPSFVAFLALGLYLNYTEQTLTLEWLPYIVFYAALAGLGMPLIVWYSMTKPLLKRINRGK
jgi:hypothetical protein